MDPYQDALDVGSGARCQGNECCRCGAVCGKLRRWSVAPFGLMYGRIAFALVLPPTLYMLLPAQYTQLDGEPSGSASHVPSAREPLPTRLSPQEAALPKRKAQALSPALNDRLSSTVQCSLGCRFVLEPARNAGHRGNRPILGRPCIFFPHLQR